MDCSSELETAPRDRQHDAPHFMRTRFFRDLVRNALIISLIVTDSARLQQMKLDV